MDFWHGRKFPCSTLFLVFTETREGEEGYVLFRVWAPNAQHLVLLEITNWQDNPIGMSCNEAGVWEFSPLRLKLASAINSLVTRADGSVVEN